MQSSLQSVEEAIRSCQAGTGIPAAWLLHLCCITRCWCITVGEAFLCTLRIQQIFIYIKRVGHKNRSPGLSLTSLSVFLPFAFYSRLCLALVLKAHRLCKSVHTNTQFSLSTSNHTAKPKYNLYIRTVCIKMCVFISLYRKQGYCICV